jgi:hypothetical protein
MAISAKAKEDGLLEKIGDAMIKEKGIPKTKLYFPFVLNRLCVMRIMINN